jgi:hypothetical protein
VKPAQQEKIEPTTRSCTVPRRTRPRSRPGPENYSQQKKLGPFAHSCASAPTHQATSMAWAENFLSPPGLIVWSIHPRLWIWSDGHPLIPPKQNRRRGCRDNPSAHNSDPHSLLLSAAWNEAKRGSWPADNQHWWAKQGQWLHCHGPPHRRACPSMGWRTAVERLLGGALPVRRCGSIPAVSPTRDGWSFGQCQFGGSTSAWRLLPARHIWPAVWTSYPHSAC